MYSERVVGVCVELQQHPGFSTGGLGAPYLEHESVVDESANRG
jgi:hypothetical protein